MYHIIYTMYNIIYIYIYIYYAVTKVPDNRLFKYSFLESFPVWLRGPRYNVFNL